MTTGDDQLLDATKTRRFLNFILDNFVFTFLLGVVIVFVLALAGYAEPVVKHNFIFGLAVAFCYYFGLEAAFQRTLGKLITGTIVVDDNGRAPDAGQIFARTLSRFVPFEPLSFLGAESAGWHDDWSNTRVVVRSKLAGGVLAPSATPGAETTSAIPSAMQPTVERLQAGQGKAGHDLAFCVVHSDGNQSGWESAGVVRNWYRQGIVDGSSLVCPSDRECWLPLADVVDLAQWTDSTIRSSESIAPSLSQAALTSQSPGNSSEPKGELHGDLSDESRLIARYKQLPASELLALWETGALNETANRLITTELQERGITIGTPDSEQDVGNYDI